MSNDIKATHIRYGIALKLTLLLIASILIVAGSVIGVDFWKGRQEAGDQALEAIDRNMRVAWSEVQHLGKEFSLEDGKLKAGEVVLNGMNDVTDHIVSLVGGGATIFMGDTRVATNVKKPTVRVPLVRRLLKMPRMRRFLRASPIGALSIFSACLI